MSVVINGTNGITYPDGTSQSSLSNLVTSAVIATISGTAIDFTGIPSWAKRITVMFSGVSTSGTNVVQIQLGSGSPQTTGYMGSGWVVSSGGALIITDNTTGHAIEGNSGLTAAATRYGTATFNLLGNNTWVGSSMMIRSDMTPDYAMNGTSTVTLVGSIDRIRITTVGGIDTFDAGSISIMWE